MPGLPQRFKDSKNKSFKMLFFEPSIRPGGIMVMFSDSLKHSVMTNWSDS
ncbi:MAG TPA: hypothetical protein PKA90_12805 [Ignavibacteria bacterium]|nr:hypothetical protein [Ignavibacteria bacterium]HMR41299.1 hypothetical protein [Ignavibacteria bacterium]